MQSAFNNEIHCGGTDAACLKGLSISTVLAAQGKIFDIAASQIDPSTTQSEPIRVVRDGTFITSPLDLTAAFPHVTKPILITNVQNEAGFPIYNAFPSTIPEDLLQTVVNATFGTPRTGQILSSAHYRPPSSTAAGTGDARVQLQQMGTDYIWRCSGWTFGRNWVGNGGKAFVGMYVVGATYPGNEQVPYCTSNGAVCHQDDIQIVVCLI